MVDQQPMSFAERRRRMLEEQGRTSVTASAPTPPAVKQPEFSPEVMLPDLNSDRPEDEKQIDSIINNIDFATAYNKWIGKSHAVQTKADGNMISCPNPDHADKHPSAWFTDTGLWTCAKCEDGGDVHDLAAIHFGFSRPGYKEGAEFHKLRERMAESFGWQIKKVPGGTIMYQAEEDPGESPVAPVPPVSPALHSVPGVPEAAADPGVASVDEPVPSSEAPNPVEGQVAEVAQMWADENETPEVVSYPTINWRNMVPEDTFLYEYMAATTQDDSPEEYHFWHGLLALGHVVGRNVTLDDNRPVYANLMVCLLGATGTGKSRSRGWLDTVLKGAAPYQEDGTRTTGVKIIPVPSSGEYLVSQFTYEGRDPTNSKRSLGFQPVNGIVDFDEMSALLARANRMGSTLKSTLMAFADTRDEVKIGGLQRGDFIAQGPFCSITASTQPRAIRTLLNHTDTASGFLNRWVFAGGMPKQTEAIGGSHSSTVIDLATATDYLKKVHGWGGLTRKITLSPEAHAAYVHYFNTKLNPIRMGDDTDLLKRIDLMSKKLMLLMTINIKKEQVPLDVVKIVIELMDYVINCFGIVGSNIGITQMSEIMSDIERHIVRHTAKTGRGATPRDIARYTQRKNYSLEQIKKSLDIMSGLDIIELVKPKEGTVGRPATRYRVVGGTAS